MSYLAPDGTISRNPTYITHQEADALRSALAEMRAENQALFERIQASEKTVLDVTAQFHETRERASGIDRRIEEASRTIRSGIFSAVASAFAMAAGGTKAASK